MRHHRMSINMQLKKGQKIALLDDHYTFTFQVSAPFHIDFSCFCLNQNAVLMQDSDFIFYNHRTNDNQSIQLTLNQYNQATFKINLTQLNPNQRFVFCASIDEKTATMADIDQGNFTLQDAQFEFSAQDFVKEKAVMLIEIYFKQTWRLAVASQGFNEGLPALIQHFGGEVQSPQPNKVELKKKLILDKIQDQQPDLFHLAQQSMQVLDKKNLIEIEANVALVLDATGSMNWQYKNGDVQKVLDRLLPLAMTFDQNQTFECWAFAEFATQLSDVDLNNIQNFVENDHRGWKQWNCGARWNNEPSAIQAILEFYKNADLPTYVLFISDGGIVKNREIQQLIREASKLPIFWQFVGVGGSNYGALEKLDALKGRVIDNCDFFAIDHIQQLNDTQLYEYLLQEFPTWLNKIQAS